MVFRSLLVCSTPMQSRPDRHGMNMLYRAMLVVCPPTEFAARLSDVQARQWGQTFRGIVSDPTKIPGTGLVDTKSDPTTSISDPTTDKQAPATPNASQPTSDRSQSTSGQKTPSACPILKS